MPVQIVSSDLVVNTADTNALTISALPPNLLIVEEGVLVAATGSGNSSAVLNASMFAQINVYGRLVGTKAGIESTGVHAGLTVGSAGSVIGSNYGVLSTSTAIFLVNDGEIQGGFSAVEVVGSGDTIINHGRISSVGPGGTAISFSVGGGQSIIDNDGVIDGAGGSAVNTAAGSVRLTNSGSIAGDMQLGNGTDRIDNAGGTITGTITMGNHNALMGQSDTFNNVGGTVIGTLFLGGANSIVYNNGGRIFGNVIAATYFDNTNGIVTGTVRIDGDGVFIGGASNETVLISGLGLKDIDMGAGNDIVRAFSTTGDDYVDGGAGIDTYDTTPISGSLLVDLEDGTVVGAAFGNDTILNFENAIGCPAANTLLGSDVANFLDGRELIDILDGRGGSDRLMGGTDADVLTGGFGRDILRGGSSAGADLAIDKFDYNAVGESGVTVLTRDCIMDFEDTFDRIDLLTIDAKTHVAGNQTFAFIGAGNFTAAGGQVKATVTPAGHTLVQVNNDADVAAEMSILIKGTPTLTAADFIL